MVLTDYCAKFQESAVCERDRTHSGVGSYTQVVEHAALCHFLEPETQVEMATSQESLLSSGLGEGGGSAPTRAPF